MGLARTISAEQLNHNSSARFFVTKLDGVPLGVRSQSSRVTVLVHNGGGGKVIDTLEQTAIVGSSHVTGWCIVVKITHPRSNVLFENRKRYLTQSSKL